MGDFDTRNYYLAVEEASEERLRAQRWKRFALMLVTIMLGHAAWQIAQGHWW